MFKNYLKMIFRIWRRDKIATSVNILGLAIGLAVSFLILLYVFYERSYDRFQQHADRLYRVNAQNTETGNYMATTPQNLSYKLKSEFPEIEKAGWVYKKGYLVKKGDGYIRENKILFVDPEFFDLFTFPLLEGDLRAALQDPSSILLTESMSKKYFPNENPVGMVITLKGNFFHLNRVDETSLQFKVTGVLKGISSQSHLQMDFVIPVTREVWTYGLSDNEQLIENVHLFPFASNSVHTYALLKTGVDYKEVERKFPDFIERNTDQKYPYPFDFHLQPVTDVHLSKTPVNLQLEPPGNAKKVLFLSFIGFFIILIAMINYIILTTAQSASRMKEIGLRKMVGAHRHHLVQQMLFESSWIAFCALPLAIIMIEMVLPKVNLLLDVSLSVNYLQNIGLILSMFGITLLVGILAGGYVVFYFVKFYPVHIIKKQNMGVGKKGYFRNMLITIQMVIFVGLIICSMVTKRQTIFLRDNATLGFQKENVISLRLDDGSVQSNYEILKNELKMHPSVRYVTGSMADPPAFNSILWGTREVTNPETGEKYWVGRNATSRDEISYFDVIDERNLIDYDYIEALGIQVIEGESFSEEKPILDNSPYAEYRYALVNETFINHKGIVDPVGKLIKVYDSELTIVGVVEDFHTRSLYDQIEPLVLHRSVRFIRQMIVKSEDGQLGTALAFIREKWKEINPDSPFEYSILEDTIDKMYRTEENFKDIVGYFTLLAILIACSGLFGLSLYISEQRTKEIGIRKVLGASLPQILNLLVREFCLIVLISTLIAAPIAFYVMDQWLQNFAYRSGIVWWMFALAGGLALAIALLTVSYQVIRAATANPVESLRYE